MEKKSNRVFFPDISANELVTTVGQHLREMFETLILRVVHLPAWIWHDSDDVKHIYADGLATVDHTWATFKKILSRDVKQFDDLKFITVPTMAMNARTLLLESYSWTAICILGYMLGMIVGSWEPLQACMTPYLHPLIAISIALVLPFYIQARLRKAHWPDDEQRSEAFYGSTLWGALMAFAIGKPSVNFVPGLCMFPLWIGTFSGLHEFYPVHRKTFLHITITVPFALYTGYLLFVLGSLKFAIGWTILCATVAVDLQLKFGRLKRRWAGKEMEQWETTMVFIVTHFLLSQLLSIGESEQPASAKV